LNGNLVNEEILRAQATQASQADAQAQAIVSADVDAVYGQVVKVIDIIKSSGLTHFAIQIEHR
jgi:biopolymer transport protein ExbD